MTGRILLIDDNQQMGRIVEVFLLKTRFADAAFEAVCTLEDGLASLSEQPADIIILDNYLGLHETYETPLLEIRKLTDAPVVLITGSEMSELGLDAIPTGLSGYIWKIGMTPESLDECLAQALETSGALVCDVTRSAQRS